MARRSTTRTRDDDYDPTPDESGAIGRYDDDEDEAPRRGRSRRSNQDDEDERPARRSRSSRRDEDDEDDAPRASRGRRSRSQDDDDEAESPRRSRGRRSRDEDDDKPKRERGKSTTVGRGWGAVEKMKVGEYVNRWQVPEKPSLIKFLEEEPFTVYSEHFLEELPKGQKKSFVCLGDDCPLCDELGDVPSPYAGFNVLDLADPDNPKVVFLRAPGGLAKKIKEVAQEKRSKPINRIDVYFEISRKAEAGARYQFALVKARDLEEDWDVTPFEEDEIEPFLDDLISEDDVVFIDTRSKLKQVVNQIDGD